MADIILPKISDEIVQAALRTSASIPARSILFNIDQKFDGAGGDHTAPILEVFMKVLNELHGYYVKQGYIAKSERDLDSRGDFVPFKATYEAVNGTPVGKRPRGPGNHQAGSLREGVHSTLSGAGI